MADTNGTFPNMVIDIGSSSQRPTSAAASPLAQRVEGTLREVLAWRPRTGDSKSFVAALNQAFTIRETAGHTEWEWTPRSYAIQADMGAVTGAQASIYARAKAALDQSRPLLEGLYPLRSDADHEDADAIRALVISQLTELVGELGKVGGPRVPRVDGLFDALLGDGFDSGDEPDDVEGLMGTMRERFGFDADRVNTIDEEQNLTNFLIVVDHTTGLFRSWETLKRFFDNIGSDVFLGTQLVLLSRALDVIAESVHEAQFVMDSVFLGAGERQTIRLDNGLTIDELLSWVESFASLEAKQIIRDAGKDGVVALQPTLETLQRLVAEALAQAGGASSNPQRGFHTERVEAALDELHGHIDEAVDLAKQLRRNALRVSSVFPATIRQGESVPQLVVNGNGFELGARLDLVNQNAVSVPIPASAVVVVSGERLFADIGGGRDLPAGIWSVQVVNPDGDASDPNGVLVKEGPAAPPAEGRFVLDPPRARQGERLTITFRREEGLRFAESDRVFFDQDITVVNRTLTAAGELEVEVEVMDDADVTDHDVFVTLGDRLVILEGAFTVTADTGGTERFVIEPPSAAAGTSTEITIINESGEPFTDDDEILVGKGLELVDFQLKDATHLVAKVEISPGADIRAHAIFLTVGGEPVKLGFNVTAGGTTPPAGSIITRALLVNTNHDDKLKREKQRIAPANFLAMTPVKHGDGVDAVELELNQEAVAGALPAEFATAVRTDPRTKAAVAVPVEATTDGKVITVRRKAAPRNFPAGQYKLTLHLDKLPLATGTASAGEVEVTFAVEPR